MSCKIAALSYVLPKIHLSNEKLSSEFPEWSVEKISNKIGISNRCIAADDQCSSDLAFEAAQKLFLENSINPKDVEFIILCTQSPDYFLPTSACLLQERLGIPTTAGAFDFNLGCSGYVYGLSIAKGLIVTNDLSNVLLIMAETYSKFIHSKDKGNRSIFGDAASACLVVKDSTDALGPFVFGTDGSGAKNLIVEYGGLRNRRLEEASEEFDLGYGSFSDKKSLFMNGTEIFNFTLREVPRCVDAVLKKANLLVDDVDLFIFHQANKYMLDHLRKKVKIPENKFFIYMENCGNTVSSTIPIALKEAINSGAVSKGSTVCLVGFGVGYSWGGCIIKI